VRSFDLVLPQGEGMPFFSMTGSLFHLSVASISASSSVSVTLPAWQVLF
jgi:hypothetical protein